MFRSRLLIIALYSLLILCLQTAAQTSTGDRPASLPNKQNQPAAKPEPKQLQKERRDQEFALQIVLTLADESRSYQDEALRAGVQARAADILWDYERERARAFFHKAWEFASTADRDGRRRNEEARRRRLAGQSGSGFIPPPPNLRAEVLRLAARRDRALAEHFLSDLEEETKQAAAENNSKQTWDPTEPPQATSKRLELARQLLESGDTERALQLATPGLVRVTTPGIMFLVTLRQKNASLADQFYALLLEKAASDPLADATAVALLSCYIFTPSKIVTVTHSGLLVNEWTASLPPPNLSTVLRARFFQTAAQILLRPLSSEQSSAGPSGTYFTILRLLPFFEQYDSNVASALQAQSNLIAQGTTDIIPAQYRSFLETKTDPAKKDALEDLLAQAERATGSERDSLYARAAHATALKNDRRAQELADRVEAVGLRKRVRNFVDLILVANALQQKDIEACLQLLRNSEVSSLQRVWVYTELARWRKNAEPQRARELLAEAVTEANRNSPTSQDSAHSWIAIALRMIEIDRSRRWETATEAVKAINRVADYASTDKLTAFYQSKGAFATTEVPASSLDLEGLFATLGKEDLGLAASLARNLTSEYARSKALFAAARSKLTGKSQM